MKNIDNPKQLREMIRILERKLGILKESELSCHGVTISQCHALVEIGRAKNISLNELAELLNLDNSTMSRTVNNLVTNGLAQRDIDSQDRRYVTIALTTDGNRLYEDIEQEMNQYYRKIYEKIPENKRPQVLESMQILLDSINENDCCR